MAELIGYILGVVLFGYLIAKFGFARSYEKKNGTQISKEVFRKYWIIASGIMAVIAVLGLVMGWV